MRIPGKLDGGQVFHDWLSARLSGRRKALILILFGIFHVSRALVILQEGGSWNVDDAILHYWFPLWLRFVGWSVSGLLALFAGLSGYLRPLAWALLIVMPIQRVVSYGWSFLMAVIPEWPPGRWESLSDLLIWFPLAAIIYILAGWAEPERR